MRSSIHGPPSRSETVTLSTTVSSRRRRPSDSPASSSSSAAVDAVDRADDGRDRAALDAQLDRELALVIVVGSLEHPVERELEIVEDVERDLVTCRDAADDQPDDGRERPLARN